MNTLDNQVEKLLNCPYWVVDFLPCQVPADSAGQFFKVEEYYLEEPRHQRLCRHFADVLLKLNCYHDLTVNRNVDDEWVKNPAPETLESWLTDALKRGHLCALIDDGAALITASGGDTHMTLYGASSALLELVGQLAMATGLFLWPPQDNE